MPSNYAFTEMFKNAFDFNQLFSTQRRNIEALSEANQVIVEGAQAVARSQAEAIRENVEGVLKASKDIFTGGTPEANIGKQSELAKSIFESTLSNLREITEMVTKSSFEAFDVINKRTAETMAEIGKAAGTHSAPKKKASS